MNRSPQHISWYARPAFFLLLPVFFVLHGLRENAGFVSFIDSVPLLGLYIASTLLLYALCWLILRSHVKAALGSFILMGVHFFFGSVHDMLKSFLADSFIVKYSVFLPILIVLVVLVFWLIKKARSPLRKTSVYLNLLFALLIVWDGIGLLAPAKPKRPANSGEPITICLDCDKPDIYLIVLDEYAGHQSLKDLFGFDNSAFIQQMRNRGFYVAANSRSNYNYTPFSMASMLNMSYLDLKNTDREKPDLRHAFGLINDNTVQRILEAHGYEFYNYSMFNLPNRPALVDESFIPARTRLITSQTLLSRLYRDLGYHLTATLKIDYFIKDLAYHELRNNTKLYDLTWKLSPTPSSKPRFVYTHLMMPHYPYYFDRNGIEMDPKRVLPEANNVNRQDYVEYLQYTNKKILELADHILKSSAKPPVIIIMSDHGFRHFREPVAREYHFMNLNTVYLPDKNYKGFYDSVSNVNQFRLLFNSAFNTNFAILIDSSVYLKD